MSLAGEGHLHLLPFSSNTVYSPLHFICKGIQLVLRLKNGRYKHVRLSLVENESRMNCYEQSS